MNIFRVVAVICIIMWLLVAAAFGLTLPKLPTSGPETARAATILALFLVLFAMLIWFKLCLASARDRLKGSKRSELDGRLAKWLETLPSDRKESRFARFCEALLEKKRYTPCGEIPIDVIRRPDPCLYSQFFLMDQGLPVTWDNPDVRILLEGVEQYTYDLKASTTYSVEVSLKNSSPYFDAISTDVQVNMLTFGIGGPSPTSLLTTSQTIAANTPPNAPAVVSFDWTTPAQDGHYCLQVLLSHPDDVNPANNEGWNNTHVHAAEPGQKYTLAFPVWNRAMAGNADNKRLNQKAIVDRFANITLAVDGYELRATPDPHNVDVVKLFEPKAAKWGATVSPTSATVADPGRPIQAELTIDVPIDAIPGTRAVFNVTGDAGGIGLGGITVYLDVVGP